MDENIGREEHVDLHDEEENNYITNLYDDLPECPPTESTSVAPVFPRTFAASSATEAEERLAKEGKSPREYGAPKYKWCTKNPKNYSTRAAI
jgi:hypothetical protein